jgi:hypothetical protein
MKQLLLAVFSTVLLLSSAVFAKDFPLAPEPEMTPGSVCDSPTEYRYAEKIPYCKRNVDTAEKRDIIKAYDDTFGYRIQTMDRQQFKIDHYIPLCMGGSNDRSNLWPQHRTVFEKTDSLEQELCQKMSQGLLKQAEAIEMIKHAKNNLDEIDEIEAALDKLQQF